MLTRLGGDGDPGQPQDGDQPLQFLHREPQVNEGPQGHVAADAGETVKKGPAFTSGATSTKGSTSFTARASAWRTVNLRLRYDKRRDALRFPAMGYKPG